VATRDVQGEAVDQLGRAQRFRRGAVAGCAHAVEPDGVVDGPQQIGGEQQGAVHDGDDRDLVVAVVRLLSSRPSCFTRRWICAGEQDALEVRMGGGRFLAGISQTSKVGGGAAGNLLAADRQIPLTATGAEDSLGGVSARHDFHSSSAPDQAFRSRHRARPTRSGNQPGELFLLGPSGCGKTTLLRTLAGFYLPKRAGCFSGMTRSPAWLRTSETRA
jgi:hypothetical protein